MGFFFSNATHQQIRQLLKQQIDIECFPESPLFFNDCYEYPPMNVLQNSYIMDYNNNSYDIISNTYLSHFSINELQEMILLDSKDYIPFIVAIKRNMSSIFYAKYLKTVFNENENSLKAYLNEKIGLTKLSIIEVISQYDDREEFVKIFTDLYDSNND